jgi:hypothetical protein
MIIESRDDAPYRAEDQEALRPARRGCVVVLAEVLHELPIGVRAAFGDIDSKEPPG